MVGTGSGEETATNPFRGTFDGYGHTLTFNISASERLVAPFRYIYGATIQNLTVAGSNTSTAKQNAGMVACCFGTVTISNCVVSATITNNCGGDAAMHFNNSYYRTAFGTAQGISTSATGSTLQALLGDGWKVINGDVVPKLMTTLTLQGYTTNTDGWYLISSPMAETVNPTSVTNMLSNTYDLFRFNQNAEMEWQNYKIHNNDAQNPFNALVSGQGYLYANSEDVTLTFFGTPYNGDGVVDLEYSDDNTDSRMWGWNLIGNPFGTTATIDKDFYRMNDDHTEIIAATDNNIAPMEGVLVHATGSGQNVTFTTGGSKGGEKNCDNIIINLEHSKGTVIDRAIVSFDEGRTLPKLQIDENNNYAFIGSPADSRDRLCL